ncbi:MAG: SCO family protein [Myxococcota bacterium]
MLLGSACSEFSPATPTEEVVLEGTSRDEVEAQGRGAGPLPFYGDAAFTPHWLEPGSEVVEAFHRIPSFSFTNQAGDEVTDQTFAGKIYVADFFFTTCPGICKSMTKNMAMLQDAFADDDRVRFLSHSVTPDVDDVSRLATYAEANGVREGTWHLVTGDREEIYRLGRRAYFADEDQGREVADDEFLHTENFVLVDGNGHIRGIYNGLNKASLHQLIADVERLETLG